MTLLEDMQLHQIIVMPIRGAARNYGEVVAKHSRVPKMQLLVTALPVEVLCELKRNGILGKKILSIR